MAIETKYAGHLFRSRLEARWAAMFDLVGWTWTYEPLDANGYIPDFLIHGARPMIVEVKPASDASDLMEQGGYIDDAIKGHWKGETLILGVGPLVSTGPFSGDVSLGMLGEVLDDDLPSDTRDYSDALFTQCGKCHEFGIYHALMSYATRPCGHHSGDHYLHPVDLAKASRLWGAAHEATRWVGARR